MEKSKEDYTIRYLCARVAAVIIILGAVCFLTGQPFARGATLCFMSILLMAMAIGYEQIDFVFKMIRVRLKKKQN